MSKPKNDENKTPPPPPTWPLNQKEKSEGVGDTISKIIKMISGGKIKECDKCKKRKEKLNQVLPYNKENDEVQDD
jgi:hypothetical protein